MDYTSLEAIKNLYKKTYHIVDDTIIDVMLAITIGTKMDGDPIWLMIIGAPSSGKSELINILSKVDFVHQVSNLTDNTFLSGMRGTDGKDNSLLHNIGKRGMIIMKDYTSILSMKRDKREVIVGQMREIFDGKITKKTGNGNNPTWIGKINFIGGCTDAIYTSEGESAGMGRRNINYVMPVMSESDRILTARTSRLNTNTIEDRRQAIQEAVAEFLAYKLREIPADLPQVEEELSEEILRLSNFVTRVRTAVERDYQGRVKHVHSIEMPMRMSNQIHQLAQYFAFMADDGQISDNHKQIIYKVCLDSIPKNLRLALEELTRYKRITTKGLALKLRYPTETVKNWLEDLNVLGVCNRTSEKGGMVDQWEIKPEYREIIAHYDHVDMVEQELTAALSDSNALDYIAEEVDPGWLLEANENAQGQLGDF